jgi:2-oxoglutarate/2-oxoacid ferredoxin oxidoreductase subunit alpha
MANVSIRIAGANGDGVESTGALLGKIAALSGMEVFGNRGYQSVIRGGHVWYQIRIGDEKLYSAGDSIDVLVALNQDSIVNQKSHLSDKAIVIYDSAKCNVTELEGRSYKLIDIPFLEIVLAAGGDSIMRNMVSIGAVLKVVGIDISLFDAVINKMFLRKGIDVVNKNIKVATDGYSYKGVENVYSIKGDGKPRYLLDGNTAVSLGAYAAGCKYYAAYPMTPASGILQWFAAHADRGVLYKQTEDEIAAINSAIGASSAGVRAMCGSSGGGFALMVEALGLAGMLETPLVVVESQRTGPSTGLPSKTEQGDLLFVMHASQGEFPRIVVAPRSMEECFSLTADAFNLADRYQCPAIILVDAFISERVESVVNFDVDSIKIDRGKMADASATSGRFKRYELTDDGISPRSVPGMKGLSFVAPSYEHNEYGELVSDVLSGLDAHVEMRKKMQEKRMRKMDTMLKQEKVFAPNIENENAKHFLVAFGSTTSVAREAMAALNKKGLDFGLISFSYILPLDSERTKRMLSGKHLIDVECNYTAQLAKVIRMETGVEVKDTILRYDGENITCGEIVDKAAKIVGSQ